MAMEYVKKKSHTLFSGNNPREEEQSSISQVLSSSHTTHVDLNYNWTKGQGDIQKSFTFEKRLGKGAYGEVWKGKHNETGITMAIKKISIKMQGTVEEDVKNEIEVLKKCRFPHIVSYYGVVTAKGEFWILMDWCALGSLLDLILGKTPRLQLKVQEKHMQAVMAATVKALVYLHGKDIIHRDIKCGNILLSETGEPKLADFGLSFQKGTNVSAQGSALWLPPELLVPDEDVIPSPLSDIWSLGISLIEMAQDGKPPHWEIGNLMRSMFIIGTSEPPEFKEPEKWTPACRNFLSRCLVKDPNKRASSVALLEDPWLLSAPEPKAVFVQQVLIMRDMIKEEEFGKKFWTINASIFSSTETLSTRMKATTPIHELTARIKNRLSPHSTKELYGLFIDSCQVWLEDEKCLYHYSHLVQNESLSVVLKKKTEELVLFDYFKLVEQLKQKEEEIQKLRQEKDEEIQKLKQQIEELKQK